MKRYQPRWRRRSLRLKGYDYSRPGAYFVTVCTQDRVCLFGDVIDGEMVSNDMGSIVQQCWHDLPHHYPHLDLDVFVIMPNHVHGVLMLLYDDEVCRTIVGAGLRPARGRALPEIIRAFKAFSSRRINQRRDAAGTRVWQRSCYERVIRNEEELDRARRYVADNPGTWLEDENNPAHGW